MRKVNGWPWSCASVINLGPANRAILQERRPGAPLLGRVGTNFGPRGVSEVSTLPLAPREGRWRGRGRGRGAGEVTTATATAGNNDGRGDRTHRIVVIPVDVGGRLWTLQNDAREIDGATAVDVQIRRAQNLGYGL